MFGRQTLLLVVLPALLGSGSVACSKQSPALYGSSSGQGSYALKYVDSLTATRQEIAAVEAQVEAARAELPTYPDSLSETSWPDVKAVYLAADEAGRTGGYVEEVERSQVVARFYVDEKEDLNRRVGGAVQHAAKEKSCDADLYGPASYALGKGFEEQIEERLRESNDAHRYIDDNEDALGKKNRPVLEKQADGISRASYLAHVAMPRLKQDLERRADEASSVESTLKSVAEESKAKAADPKLSKEQRKKHEDRAAAATAALSRIEPEADEAKKLVKVLDERASAAKKKYEDAFDALEDAVDAKAKAAPPPAGK